MCEQARSHNGEPQFTHLQSGLDLGLAGMRCGLAKGCSALTSSCSSSLSSSLTTGLARDPRLGRRRPPFSRSWAFSLRPSLIFTLTERAVGQKGSKGSVRPSWHLRSSMSGCTAASLPLFLTHTQTRSLPPHPPLPLHFLPLHCHPPSRSSAAHW